jgi:hypothetical protein
MGTLSGNEHSEGQHHKSLENTQIDHIGDKTGIFSL